MQNPEHPDPIHSRRAFLQRRTRSSGTLNEGGSKGGMKVGGVKEISPNLVESTMGML